MIRISMLPKHTLTLQGSFNNRDALILIHVSILLRASELLVEDHCRATGEADSHPCGFINFVLREAFLFNFFQMFEAKELS